MTPVNKASGLSPLIPIPWAALRAWLDAAEQGQAASGGATRHLAHAQLLALSQLVSFCAEPPVPKEDHVSKLMRMSSAPLAAAAAVAATPMEGVQFANGEACGPEFSQGHRLEPPSFEMSDPVDVPFKGVFQLRWHCECVLPWCSERFPKREEGKPPALFSNKKVRGRVSVSMCEKGGVSFHGLLANTRTIGRQTVRRHASRGVSRQRHKGDGDIAHASHIAAAAADSPAAAAAAPPTAAAGAATTAAPAEATAAAPISACAATAADAANTNPTKDTSHHHGRTSSSSAVHAPVR